MIEICSEEEAADLALRGVLEDEPGWAADVLVHALELEMETDEIRLRSTDAELIDLSFQALPPADAAQLRPVARA